MWSTDKDGILLDLLAAEILARTGRDPAEHYRELTGRFGAPIYTRIDAPATPSQKSVLKKLSPDAVRAKTLAGEPITAKLTRAPGNGGEIGGLKVVAENGWFAARPSGTEDVYKIYAESFKDQAHLDRVLDEARAMVTDALSASELPGRARELLISRRSAGTSRPPAPGFASCDQRRVRTARAAAARPSSHRSRPRPATAAPSPRSA